MILLFCILLIAPNVEGLAQTEPIKTTPRPSDTKIQLHYSDPEASGQHSEACAKPAVVRSLEFMLASHTIFRRSTSWRRTVKRVNIFILIIQREGGKSISKFTKHILFAAYRADR